MCHSCMEPTREGNNSTPRQESSGSLGSCAKPGRETPQAWLEELGWEEQQMCPGLERPRCFKGSEIPQKPSAMKGDGGKLSKSPRSGGGDGSRSGEL